LFDPENLVTFYSAKLTTTLQTPNVTCVGDVPSGLRQLFCIKILLVSRKTYRQMRCNVLNEATTAFFYVFSISLCTAIR